MLPLANIYIRRRGTAPLQPFVGTHFNHGEQVEEPMSNFRIGKFLWNHDFPQNGCEGVRDWTDVGRWPGEGAWLASEQQMVGVNELLL